MSKNCSLILLVYITYINEPPTIEGVITIFLLTKSVLALFNNSFWASLMLAGLTSDNIRHSSLKFLLGRSVQFEPIKLNTLSINPIKGVIPIKCIK